MFFTFYGNDEQKIRKATKATTDAAKKKHADAEFFKLNIENFSENKLDELIQSQGLFYSAFIVEADNLCEDSEIAEIVLKKIKEIKNSPNFFIFLEGKLNKAELEKFKKYGDKTQEFIKPEKKLNKKEMLAIKGEKIDFFDFSNALGERNKKLLWTLYQDALVEEVPAEEVHGILFWQVKAMLVALKCENATEAGLNPFVYNKAKNYAKNYSEEKLKQMSAKLFEMYHEAHRGKIDFAIALEKFILEL